MMELAAGPRLSYLLSRRGSRRMDIMTPLARETDASIEPTPTVTC